MTAPHRHHHQRPTDVRRGTSPLTPRALRALSPPSRNDGAEPGAVIALAPASDSLVGRDHEVAEILGRLGQSQILTLTGAPGVGKSRLALEVAGHLRAGKGPSPVVMRMEQLSHARQVGPAVGQALREAEGLGWADRGPSEDLPLVVILDDCDHLLDACADAAHGLLGRGVRVLATARQPLAVQGESTWRVPPLAVPQPGHDDLPEVFTESEAVQPFCDRAASAKRGFIPAPATAPSIAEICRRLDGVPLAIEPGATNRLKRWL